MSNFTGMAGHETTGTVGVAVIPGVGGNLAFQNFSTNVDATELTACLTMNGNLEKRTVALGTLPASSGSFSVSFPADTDIGLFNVLVVQASEVAVGQARIV